MSRKQLGTFLLGLLLLSFAGDAALAQPESQVSDRVPRSASLAGELYLGPHIGYSFIGDTDLFCECFTDSNDFLLFGGRFGYYFTDNLAAELTGQWLRPDNHDSFVEATVGGLYNFTPSIPGWNTYVGAGGGISNAEGSDNGIAYLAVGSEYRFNKLTGLRLELKGQYNFSGTGEDSFGEFDTDSRTDIQPSIGLLFHFGGKPAPVIVEAPPAPEPPPAPAPPAAATEPAPAPAPPIVTPPPPMPPTVDDIDFDRGRSRVTNLAKARLDAVALRLRENPRATVVITGYPDGSAGAGREALARQRAENAKQYLIDRHAIDASRITTETNLTDSEHRGQAVIVVTFQNL